MDDIPKDIDYIKYLKKSEIFPGEIRNPSIFIQIYVLKNYDHRYIPNGFVSESLREFAISISYKNIHVINNPTRKQKYLALKADSEAITYISNVDLYLTMNLILDIDETLIDSSYSQIKNKKI